MTTASSSAINPSRFTGQVAVVTASTKGIGLATALRLAKEGAKVVISSRKQENVDEAMAMFKEQGLEVWGMVCHVGNEEHRQKLLKWVVDTFGRLDILVNNAAVNPVFGPLIESPIQAYDKIMDVNCRAPLQLAMEAHAVMSEQETGGKIVFVSSIAGIVPFEMLGYYSISKSTLFAITKVLAREWGPDNIRVNAVAPGVIKTKFSEALWKNKDIVDKVEEQTPLGRIGNPDEIAAPVCFLVSDEASYVTGETTIACGGSISKL